MTQEKDKGGIKTVVPEYRTPAQNAVRKQIAQHELQLWENTQYQTELRLRIARKLGDDEKPIMNDLTRCETAIDVLMQEINRLSTNAEE